MLNPNNGQSINDNNNGDNNGDNNQYNDTVLMINHTNGDQNNQNNMYNVILYSLILLISNKNGTIMQ